MTDPRDIFTLIGYVEDDLRGVHAKLTEIRAMLASMDLPTPKANICPRCHITVRPPTSLHDHLWNAHQLEMDEANA